MFSKYYLSIRDAVISLSLTASLKHRFRDSTEVAICLCQIGISLSLLWTRPLADFSEASIELMRAPKGILYWLPFLKNATLLNAIGDIYPLLGILSVLCIHRFAFALFVLCATVLASAQYSFAVGWSHAFNVHLLASYCLLTIDTGLFPLKKRIDLFPRKIALFSTLFMIAFMFGNAGLWKSFSGDHMLQWISPENIRNQIIMQWFVKGQELPWLAQFLFSIPGGPYVFSVGNTLMQLGSLFGIAFVVLVLRSYAFFWLAGLPIAGEILGLYTTMGMPLLYMLLLTLPFFFPYAKTKISFSHIDKRSLLMSAPSIAIVLFEIVLGFKIELEERLYPFTSYPMYSDVKISDFNERYSCFFLHNQISIHAPGASVDGKQNLIKNTNTTFYTRFLSVMSDEAIRAHISEIQMYARPWARLPADANMDDWTYSISWRLSGFPRIGLKELSPNPADFIEPVIDLKFAKASNKKIDHMLADIVPSDNGKILVKFRKPPEKASKLSLYAIPFRQKVSMYESNGEQLLLDGQYIDGSYLVSSNLPGGLYILVSETEQGTWYTGLHRFAGR